MDIIFLFKTLSQSLSIYLTIPFLHNFLLLPCSIFAPCGGFDAPLRGETLRAVAKQLYTVKNSPLLWLPVCVRHVGNVLFLPVLFVCAYVPEAFALSTSLSFPLFSLLSFSTLRTNKDTAAEVQLCACTVVLPAPPLLSVSLCLTRSSVHKVAVHLSARREGLIERQGRGHQGAGSSWKQPEGGTWCICFAVSFVPLAVSDVPVSLTHTTSFFFSFRLLVFLCTEQPFSKVTKHEGLRIIL